MHGMNQDCIVHYFQRLYESVLKVLDKICGQSVNETIYIDPNSCNK